MEKINKIVGIEKYRIDYIGYYIFSDFYITKHDKFLINKITGEKFQILDHVFLKINKIMVYANSNDVSFNS